MRIRLIVLLWIVVCIIAFRRAREATTTPNVTVLALCIYETFQVLCLAAAST